MDDELVRGALTESLGDVLNAQAEVTRAAGLWTIDRELSSAILLENLGKHLRNLSAACDAAITSALGLHRAEMARLEALDREREQAQLESAVWMHARMRSEAEQDESDVLLGRWSNDS